MPRTAQFYSSERATPLPPEVREDFARRIELARLLMPPQGQPIHTPLGGIAQMLQQGLAGLAEGRIRKQREKRETAAQETLMRALMGEQVNAAEGPPRDFGGGVTSQELTRTPNTQGDMARILAGNPDTAGMGFNMRLAEMEAQRAAQSQAAAEAADHQRAIELKQTAPGRAPVPGTDVPLPEDVAKQRLTMALAGRKAQDQYRQMTPEEVQTAGFMPGTTAQINTATGKIDTLQSPSQGQAARTPDGKASLRTQSAIRSYAAGLFGGTFNPLTGDFSGLEPEQMRQVVTLANRATTLFDQGNGSNVPAFIEQALNQMRGGKDSGGPPTNNDIPPIDLRSFGTTDPNAIKSRLVRGRNYRLPNGDVATWNGQEFEVQ